MNFFLSSIVAIAVIGFILWRRGRDQWDGSVGSARWLRIAALIPLSLQVAVFLLFGIGEMVGGDLSGAGHLLQVVLAVSLGILAWMRPLEGGVVLFITGLLTYLSFPDAAEFSIGGIILAAPPVLSGLLFTIAGMLARGASTPEADQDG
jgi:hypothetical protein